MLADGTLSADGAVLPVILTVCVLKAVLPAHLVPRIGRVLGSIYMQGEQATLDRYTGSEADPLSGHHSSGQTALAWMLRVLGAL